MKRICLLLLLGVASVAVADEGMWTFDNFPQAVVKQKYGVDIDAAWLGRVQRSITRLEGGCTGSFASPDGLVLTNHHCAMACISNLSSATDNFVEKGFNSGSRAGERQCPGGIISVLVGTEDITAKVNAAIAGMPDAQANTVRKQTLSRLESECTARAGKGKASPFACESVTLYQGGQYFLYVYKRYDDVRLVFAPEAAMAQFGGDPDNFNFPRWCLDFSLMRIYENGKPARTPDYLRWRPEGPRDGDAVFVAGHPGSTSRLLTVDQLKFQRGVTFPAFIARNSELRGRMIEWGTTGDEPQRIVDEELRGLENALKVYRGLQSALLDDRLMESKATAERELRASLDSNAKLAQLAGTAWDDIAKAQARYREIYDRVQYLENGTGFNSDLFAYARLLVRGAAERAKPNEQRLREYADSSLPKLSAGLLATTPIYPEFETLTLGFSLDKMREALGPDDDIVHRVLGKESPATLASRLIKSTKLADPAVRKALWEGGAAAVDASQDPMIVLARSVDPDARAVRKIYEDEVQAQTVAGQAKIAKARFAVLGTKVYPDATFTLRLSYGAVRGWVEKGQQVEPFTKLGRLYERATGEDPFRVTQRWADARSKLDLNMPYDFVTTNDIVGGNSGSPVIDGQGRLVGLAFDGNIHSIAGSYWYDETLNRAVAVHPGMILTALRQVYGAPAIAREILGGE
jgi:peptidase S46-like protein